MIPRGYISIREALNRVGRELFGPDWTGEEHKARRGLISEDEWLKRKDLAQARGSGAPGSGRETVPRPPVKATPHSTATHPTLGTTRSIGRMSGTRRHVIGFAVCLRPVIEKQPSWILGAGHCIEPRLQCGVGPVPIG
jgi:hypothetical protein